MFDTVFEAAREPTIADDFCRRPALPGIWHDVVLGCVALARTAAAGAVRAVIRWPARTPVRFR